MIVAHLLGFPVEESVVQLVPAGALAVTVTAFAGRVRLGRMLDRLRRR